MHFDDSEKPGRKAALQTLMKMIGGMRAEKLGSMKKPAIEAVSVEHAEPDDDDKLGGASDVDADDMPSKDEPSEEEKAKIAELYHRYCK